MSSEERNVDINVRAKNSTAEGFSEAKHEADGFFDWVSKKSKDLRKEASESGERAFTGFARRGVEGFADFGLDALGVGIPALITQVVGGQLKEFSGSAVEIRDQIAEGRLSDMDAFDKFAGSVPVIGDFWSAGRNLHELGTGEKQQQKREEEFQKLDNEMVEGRLKFFETINDDRRRMQEQVYDSRMAARIASEWQYPEKQQIDSIYSDLEKKRTATEDAIREHNKQIDAAFKESNKARLEKIGKLDEYFHPETFGQKFFLGASLLRSSGREDFVQNAHDLVDLRGEQARAADDVRNAKDTFAGQQNDLYHFQEQEAQSRLRQVEKKAAEQRSEIIFGNDQNILDGQARFNAERLRLQGKGLEAESVEIQRWADREKTVRHHQVEEQIKNLGDTFSGHIFGGVLRAQEFAQDLGTDAEANLRRQAAQRQDRLERRSAGDELFNFGGEMLDRLGNLPGHGRDPQLMAEQYKFGIEAFRRQKTEELTDLLHTRKDLAPDIAQAQAAVDRYSDFALSPAEVRRATFGQEGPLQLPGYAELPMGTSGLAEAAKAGDLDQQTKEQTSVQKETRDQTKLVVQALTNIANKIGTNPDIFNQ